MKRVNAQFDQPVIVESDALQWVPSPMAGVSRCMLDRIGGERARATSLVRYNKDSEFSEHTHHGGEEFLVLEGIFEDEHGRYPAGTYVRNPPQSSHCPGTREGCLLFVKLWQFDLRERRGVTLSSEALPWESIGDGRERRHLHDDERERVVIERWAPGTEVTLGAHGGLELLMLRGEIRSEHGSLGKYSWLRFPESEKQTVHAGAQGALVYVKTGHLRWVSADIEALRENTLA